MKRRVIAFFLAILLGATLLSSTVFANMDASDYILVTSAGVSQGNSGGKISVDYSITGTNIMDVIGVFKIIVFKSDGTTYTTIYGSVPNGLLRYNSGIKTGSYEVTCVAGQSYYCKVTLIAVKDGGYDTRTITTGTITAPYSPY